MQFSNATDGNGSATGDQVVVPTPSFDFTGSTATLMFWIKTAGNIADGGNVQGAMSRRSAVRHRMQTALGFGIYLADDGTLKLQAGNGSTLLNSVSSTASVKDNLWHHVALVYSVVATGVCTFYVDGVAAGSQTNTNSWAISFSQQFEIGRSHDTFWRHLNGQLDDFRYYNTGLSQAQNPVDRQRRGRDR